jgi:hypothetical protein
MKGMWKITFGGYEMTNEQVTVGHVIDVCALVGDNSWSAVSPLTSPQVLAGWCAVVLSRGTGQELALCAAFVNSLPLATVLDAVTEAPETPLEAPVSDATPEHPLLAATKG